MPGLNNEKHSTMQEIRFIDGLGSFSADGKRIGYIKMLKRYLLALQRRARWDDSVDVLAVMDHAQAVYQKALEASGA